MYLRAAHTDLHLSRLYAFIRTNPLGIFTTAIPSLSFPTIQSSHIPWVLDVLDEEEEEEEEEVDPTGKLESYSDLAAPKARLRGHLARANPQCKALIEAATSSNSNILKEEVLVLFNGPVDHYITPKFYVETKPSTGKVVPTWDYSAVQVYGKLTLHLEASSDFLAKQLNDLSAQSERIFGYDGREGRQKAWTVDESPESYVGLLKKAIIGIEVEVERIAGKWKMSQELKDGDRKGVIEGFERLGTDDAKLLAKSVKERAELQRQENA